MSIQDDLLEEKTLDILEVERRVKIGRSLSNFLYPMIWATAAFYWVVWLFDTHYIQFFLAGVLIIPFGITVMLQSVFEAKGQAALWGHLFLLNMLLVIFITPLLVPEAMMGLVVVYAINIMIRCLLLGSKQIILGAVIGIPAVIITILVDRIADRWFAIKGKFSKPFRWIA